MAEVNTTKEYYDKNAASWAAAHDTDPNFWGKEIDSFTGMTSSNKVIDVGCGHGRDARALIAKGFDYTGTDLSLPQLAQNHLRNPSARLVQANLLELPFGENSFDGFWASAVLLHIPKRLLSQALAEIQRVTKPQGIGYIAVKKGLTEETDPEGRYWSYYQEEEFEAILETHHLKVYLQETKPLSERTTFLTYLVRNLK